MSAPSSPGGVHRHAHQPSRQLALEAVPDRDVGGVRAAVSHRHAEALGGAHGDVGAEFARRHQHGEGQQVRGHRGERTRRGGGGDDRAQVADLPGGVGIGQQHPEQLPGWLGRDLLLGYLGDHQVDAERLGPGGQHGKGLWQAVGVGEEDAALARRPPGQRHRLGRGGGLVKQRGAGHVEPGQVLDHGLEVEQRLEPPLGDLGLIRRVGRVPGGVLQHVAADDRRGAGPVVAQADHGGQDLVGGGQLAEDAEGFVLRRGRRQAGQAGAGGEPGGQGRRGQLVQRGVSERAEHVVDVSGRGPDVACCEIHGSLQKGT